MADPTIEEIDEFIAGFKTLDGLLPEWRQQYGWDCKRSGALSMCEGGKWES